MRVKERLNKCLWGTNLTEEFEREGYLAIAHSNAMVLIHTIRKVIPRKFSESYVNPCWKANFEVFHQKYQDRSSGKVSNYIKTKIDRELYISPLDDYTSIAKTTLHMHFQHTNKRGSHFVAGNMSSPLICLPKVFLAGFPKCGSSFLYCLMSEAFGSGSQVEKEPHWWITRGPAKHPRKPEASYIPIYLLNFLDTSRKLASGRYNNSNYHQPLTIDGTPNLMFDWPRWFENEPPINYCLLPAVIPQILPDSKFVVVMRNPLDMMYSAFWFSCTLIRANLSAEVIQRGPDIFHERTAAKVEQFKECRNSHSLHWCVLNITYDAYSPEMPTCGRVRLEIGFYVVYVQRWLSVVPRDKFLFLTVNELSEETARVEKELWRLAGYPDTARSDKLRKPNYCRTNSQEHIDYHNDSRLHMREHTREMLTELFRPYSQMLANILNDTKFLWKA